MKARVCEGSNGVGGGGGWRFRRAMAWMGVHPLRAERGCAVATAVTGELDALPNEVRNVPQTARGGPSAEGTYSYP